MSVGCPGSLVAWSANSLLEYLSGNLFRNGVDSLEDVKHVWSGVVNVSEVCCFEG